MLLSKAPLASDSVPSVCNWRAKLTNVSFCPCHLCKETGCVGICVNSCKSATESFFDAHMGIPLAIEPNTEDFSCKFKFGRTPEPVDKDDIYKHPCLSQCPLRPRKPEAPCHAVALAAGQTPSDMPLDKVAH